MKFCDVLQTLGKGGNLLEKFTNLNQGFIMVPLN